MVTGKLLGLKKYGKYTKCPNWVLFNCG